MWNIHVNLFEFWTSGSGDVFKEKVYRGTDTGCRPITIAHLEPLAQVS